MNTGFRLKIGDILLIACLVLTALLLFALPLFSQQAATAEIVYAQTGQVQVIRLDTDADYPVSSRGVALTVRVEDHTVFVLHADCRDGICSSTPPISRPGQSIVCAPAGVVVRITGEEVVVDGVSG